MTGAGDYYAEKAETEQDSSGWVPAFPGQRPPFQPGHTLSLSHGAYSPRKVDPLARELVDLVLGDDTVPSYAKAPAYRAELWAWGRAEAQTQLLTEWLAKEGEAAGDGVGDLDSESVRAAYLLLHRAEARAASARTRLGLTPLAAARMGKDVAIGRAADVDVAQRMAQLHDAEQRLREQGWTPPPEWRPVDHPPPVEATAGDDQDEEAGA